MSDQVGNQNVGFSHDKAHLPFCREITPKDAEGMANGAGTDQYATLGAF